MAALAARLAAWARSIKRDVHAVYLASRDPRTPWYAKALAIGVAAYALSPIDLIPDFIPVLGQLDELIILPLGIWLVVRLIPPSSWTSTARPAIVAEQFAAQHGRRRGDRCDLDRADRRRRLACLSLALAVGYGTTAVASISSRASGSNSRPT